LRRVNQALYFLAIGAREASFRTMKTIAECLADELMNAAKNSPNSWAVKKKDEIEKVAKGNRWELEYSMLYLVVVNSIFRAVMISQSCIKSWYKYALLLLLA